MEILKPSVFICPDCKEQYSFAHQENMDIFVRLHKLTHELQEYRWKHLSNPNVTEWTPCDLDFLKACGVRA